MPQSSRNVETKAPKTTQGTVSDRGRDDPVPASWPVKPEDMVVLTIAYSGTDAVGLTSGFRGQTYRYPRATGRPNLERHRRRKQGQAAIS